MGMKKKQVGRKNTDAAFRKELGRAARALYEQGFAEANAGNISIRLDPAARETASGTQTTPLRESVRELAGMRFLVTGAETRMREVAEAPGSLSTVLTVRADGASFAAPSRGVPPTSELPMHLAVQKMLVSAKPEMRAVLHTHPPHVVVLTGRLRTADEINNALRGAHVEVPILLPEGVAVLPELVPGSWELAKATVEAFGNANVVLWPRHGGASIGETVASALDRIEIIDKAARLWLLNQ